MGKRIADIHNYPLSEGSVPLSNKLLLSDQFAIRSHTLKDYFRTIFEFARDIVFFNEGGTAQNTWNDLLAKDAVFQLSRFVTIAVNEFDRFFTQLPLLNGFTSDDEIAAAEYATLAYQRLQVIQFLFWYYRTIPDAVDDQSRVQVQSMLKNATLTQLFVSYQSLADEVLHGATPLIPEAQRVAVRPFQEISFDAIDDEITASLNAYYNPANTAGQPVLTIYSNDFDKLKAANEYAYSIFKGLLRIQQTFGFWATNKLGELTSKTNTHQPHIGLLIAFCKLILLYDVRYNRLIGQNTAFIFHDILQLQKQPVLADSAYVSIELAKNTDSYFVAKDTLFKAGKNVANKQVFYRSVKDVVLNSAKISAVKSMTQIRKQNSLFAVSAADDATSPEWQVNNAWIPFNDISDSFTGIAIESKVLEAVQKKATTVQFEFTFSKNIPPVSGFAEKLKVTLLLENDTSEVLSVTSVTGDNNVLTISASLQNDLKKSVKSGLNVLLEWLSPGKDDDATNAYAIFYRFLLSAEINKINVKLTQHVFTPTQVRTSAGLIDGTSSFTAFGAQSLSGTSFRIYHPFIQYAPTIDVGIEWADKLNANLPLSVNGQAVTLTAGTATSTINDLKNNQTSIGVELENDHIHLVRSTRKGGTTTVTIETPLPRVLLVKSLTLTADLVEVVYAKDNQRPLLWIEEVVDRQRFVRSLRLPFASKVRQKNRLRERHLQYRIKNYIFHHNNQTAHLYPFGERLVNKESGLTFLPDYSILGYADFVADLYIGLTAIKPGQSVSFLFNIAEETAEQSEMEAKISWYFITNEKIEPLDAARVIDTTQNFLQSGIVQLTLPDTATNDNQIIYGKDSYWLVARCDKNYEVVANIRSIKLNALELVRVFDAANQEAKRSVAPATIETVFPKSAHIKTVRQETPSFNGREEETEQHYFWRSSQRLRHKQRGINQWDVEQMVLEHFSNIFKVKCLNHAFFDAATGVVLAKPANVIVSLIPFYIINPDQPNFQPAIPLSKLQATKQWLAQKTSPFLQFQVLNTFWDVVSLKLEVVMQKDVQDLLFYREQLNTDLKKFFSPWAFEQEDNPSLQTKIFASTIVDFIDELPYVDFIKSLRIFRNDTEVFDEIDSSSEIHLLTTTNEHDLTVLAYGS